MSDSDTYYEKPFSFLSNLLNESKNNVEDKFINSLIKQKAESILEQNDISFDEFLALNPVKYNDKIIQSRNKKLKLKDNFNFFTNTKFKKYIANIKKSNKKVKKADVRITMQGLINSNIEDASQNIIANNDLYDDFNMNFIKPKPEEELFIENMNKVNPLKKGGRDIHPKNKDIKNRTHSSSKIIEFIISNQQDYVQAHIVGFDALKFAQLQNGFYSIEARLDLHGLNSIQAYGVLLNFIKLTWHKNLGCLLIVCGRGHNSISGFAVLKYKLQEWLTQEPFKNVVLAFCSARPYDGGTGGFYVLLRKYNSKNKINWNITPLDEDLFL